MNDDSGALLAPPNEHSARALSVPSPPEPQAPRWGRGVQALAIDRHSIARRRRSGALDWIAFVLAFLAPPLGFILGVVSVIIGLRGRGWTAAPGRAAVAIGLALSIVLAGFGVIGGSRLRQQAAHDAVVASSRNYCVKLRSDPAVLTSATFGWPAVQDSIADSITSMQKYEDLWVGLERVAPSPIRPDTREVADTAAGILASVKSTRVLDDDSNVEQMQRVAANSGIPNWVSQYCQ